MLFGFTVAIYAIFALISDLTVCIKEANDFDIIASAPILNVAEKQSSKSIGSVRNEDKLDSHTSKEFLSANEHAYKIRRASIISGYFKKVSGSGATSVNLIYILGVVPILSLIVGCVCALSSGDMLKGVFSMMMTALLCTPFSFLIFNTVSEYIMALRLKKHKVAFIGAEAAEEYAKTDTVIFSDIDTVDITSHTEIQPSKNVVMKRYIATAYEVFDALGGPLSTIELHDSLSNNENTAEDRHNLIINEIAENGINIYFKSSINILLGDRSYMRAHGINVKTDPNLSSATRGTNCSVVYMAFDGSPKLGFIINSSIKTNFLNTLQTLDKENIKVFVESYEPQINDLFFEQNKGDIKSQITVHKPTEYEDVHQRQICDSGIISASDALSLANAITFSKSIIAQRTYVKRTHFILVICGFIVACLLTLLLSATDSTPILGFLKSHISVLFNLLMFTGLVPAFINLFKLHKNTTGEHNE